MFDNQSENNLFAFIILTVMIASIINDEPFIILTVVITCLIVAIIKLLDL